MEEQKKSRHSKKSLAQKIADREELLKQAQEKVMGYSITDLRRFVKRKRIEEPESQPENSKEQSKNDNIC